MTTTIKLAREWSLNSKPEKAVGQRSTNPVPPLLAGETVVRSDAAWNASSKTAGLGWAVIEQPQNREFQKQVEFISSPLVAEALALREAVLTCKRLALKTVRFEMDSAQLVKCCNSAGDLMEIHSVAADILALSMDFDSVLFVWIPRESNAIADGLAKEALFVVETDVVEEAFTTPN